MVLNYNTHLEKREIQKKIFPLVNTSKLITLGGPNLSTYLKMFPDHVEEVEVWEKEAQVLAMQVKELPRIRDRHVICHFGDIAEAPVRKGTFYDLDFCGSAKTTAKYLKRFKNCPFSATFCNWYCSVDDTVKLVLEALGERMRLDVPHPQFNLLKTNLHDYLYTTYRDTNQMTTIFRFH